MQRLLKFALRLIILPWGRPLQLLLFELLTPICEGLQDICKIRPHGIILEILKLLLGKDALGLLVGFSLRCGELTLGHGVSQSSNYGYNFLEVTQDGVFKIKPFVTRVKAFDVEDIKELRFCHWPYTFFTFEPLRLSWALVHRCLFVRLRVLKKLESVLLSHKLNLAIFALLLLRRRWQHLEVSHFPQVCRHQLVLLYTLEVGVYNLLVVKA